MADPLDLYRDVPDDPRMGRVLERPTPEPGLLASVAKRVLLSTAPTAGGVAAFAPGAEIGGAIGAAGGPIGAAAGALIGGLATSIGGSAVAERAQNWLLDHIDEDQRRALGLDDASLAADAAAHPRATFLAGLLPQAMFLRPGFGGIKALATGAAIGAGIEAGTEYQDSGHIDPFKVAAQAAGGAILNRPTRLGAAIQTPGARLARTIATGHGLTIAEAAANETHAAMAEGKPVGEQTADEQAATIVREDHALTRASNPFVDDVAGAPAHGDRLTNAIRNVSRGTAPDFTGMTPPADWRAAAKAKIGHHESRDDYAARNPLSSASGRYQFTDRTWLGKDGAGGFARRVYPGRSDAELMALKRDPAAQERVMDAALTDYAATLRRAGQAPTPGNLYLLHFLGPEGLKVLRAAPETPLKGLIGDKAIEANASILRGRTAGDVIAEMNRRMGDPGAAAPHIERAAIEQGRDPALDVPPERAPILREAETGAFGPIHRDVVNDWTAGLARLREQGGEIPAAFEHPEIGPIDAVAGRGGPDGYGIAHIDERHPGMAERLAEILPTLPVVRQSENRIRLESADHAAGVRLDYDGAEKRWLVTAYGKDAPAPADVTRAGADGQDASPAHEAPMDIGDVPPAGKFGARPTGHAVGGYYATDAAGEILVPRGHVYGELPKRYASAEAATRAAPKLVRLRDLAPAGARPPEAPPPEALARFDDPAGDGVRDQTALIEHDLRAAIEADPGMTAVLDENGDVVNVADLLAGFDDELRQNDALRACLAPKGTA